MDVKLLGAAVAKFVAGAVLVGCLVFVPAGDLSWWRGWLLMGVLFVPMFAAGLVLLAKAPDLLRKRTVVGEDGVSESRPVEPLAADLRAGSDAPPSAEKLRIIAAMECFG